MRFLCYVNEYDQECYVSLEDISAIVPAIVLTTAKKAFKSVIYIKSDPQLELWGKYKPSDIITGEVIEL